MSDHKGHSETHPITDSDYVRSLAELLNETDLTEIEVEDGPRKVRVARKVAAAPAAPILHAAPVAAAAPAAAPVAAAAASAPAAPTEHANSTPSPMVGTVYLAPEPGAAPFAAVGSRVAAGDTILIIEAMKVMNPITAPRDGTLSAVLVDNGQPVEYDQPLFVIS